jgi:hypothetical protein
LPIARYREAPKEKGLYLIGTSDIDALPVSPGDSSDLFLGANFPQNFFMFYVGQSIDGKSTLRLRITAHVTGRGNKYIGALARVDYPMFFVTMTGQESAGMENGFLISMDPGPIFNIRDEMKRSSIHLYRETFGSMSQEEMNHLARQVALDDEFDPY